MNIDAGRIDDFHGFIATDTEENRFDREDPLRWSLVAGRILLVPEQSASIQQLATSVHSHCKSSYLNGANASDLH